MIIVKFAIYNGFWSRMQWTRCSFSSCIIHHAGLTLIEVLVAMVILLFVFLALMQTALVGIDSNMRNVLRDEAVRIAEERMNEARNIPFVSLASDTDLLSSADCSGKCPAGFSTTGECIERNLRNIADFDFCTNRTVTSLSTDNTQIDITVGWKWKDEDYTHNIRTILRSQ